MEKEDLKNAIVDFERSKKTHKDYIDFLCNSSKAFKQGIGLGGNQINEAVLEAIEELKGS